MVQVVVEMVEKDLKVQRVMELQVDQEVVEVKDLSQEQEHIIMGQDVPQQEIHLLQLLLKEMRAEQDIQVITLLQVILTLDLVVEVVQQQLVEMQQHPFLQLQVMEVQEQRQILQEVQ